MKRITALKPLENYAIWLRFDDGVEGVADLSHLKGRGVFAIWNDYEAFRAARIGSLGELVWGEDIDLCPDSLYLRVTGMKPEELFPKLKQRLTHA